MHFSGKIDRYIAAEVAAPTLLGLAIFTLVLLLGQIVKIVDLIVNKGVALGDILQLICYLLPSFFTITVPLSFLLGILLGFTRLSADSEVIALKASGISLYRMVQPVLLLGLLPALITAWATLYAQPLANQAFRAEIYSIANRHVDIGLQPARFNDDFSGLVIYAKSIDKGGQMQDLLISDERKTDAPATVLASSGRVITDDQQMTLQLELQNGSIHRRTANNSNDTYQLIRFGEYHVDLALNGTPTKSRKVRNNELTLSQLMAAYQEGTDKEKQRSALAEFHQRLAMPLLPLLFPLIGVPLGIQSSRSGRGGGFVIALIVALAYFFLMTTARTLAEQGHLPITLCMWFPNVLFLSVGLAVFRQAGQERTLPLLEWLFNVSETISSKLRRRTN